MGYRSQKGNVPGGSLLLGCLILGAVVLPLRTLPAQQENADQDDRFIMDLGIIIEPSTGDGVRSASSGAARPIRLVKGPAGAAYYESTRELKSLLDDLSAKINYLESSLDQDVDAVRLENERLRSLIRKMQTARNAPRETAPLTDISQPDARSAEPSQPVRPLAPRTPPTPHDVYTAYWTGQYNRVVTLYHELEAADMLKEEQVQLAYWCADAYFRTGQFAAAEAILAHLVIADHALQDDVIILQGLIHLRQGHPEEAREKFETIITRHPGSDYQRLAQMTLQELQHP